MDACNITYLSNILGNEKLALGIYWVIVPQTCHYSTSRLKVEACTIKRGVCPHQLVAIKLFWKCQAGFGIQRSQERATISIPVALSTTNSCCSTFFRKPNHAQKKLRTVALEEDAKPAHHCSPRGYTKTC